jgi:hypothetical protein
MIGDFDTPRGARSVVIWLDSPRQAVDLLLRLRRAAPDADVVLASEADTGAEGPQALICARVPLRHCATVSVLLRALSMPAFWQVPALSAG